MTTIERTYTDMYKKGILLNPNDKYRFRVDITTKSPSAITSFGKYFATEAAAKAYLQEMS